MRLHQVSMKQSCMASITVGMTDGLKSRPNSEWLDTGNVVARCVLHVLAAYAGRAWVYIGFGEKQSDWLPVVIPLDGDTRSVCTMGYRAVVTRAGFVTNELITGHVNTVGVDMQQ